MTINERLERAMKDLAKVSKAKGFNINIGFTDNDYYEISACKFAENGKIDSFGLPDSDMVEHHIGLCLRSPINDFDKWLEEKRAEEGDGITVTAEKEDDDVRG